MFEISEQIYKNSIAESDNFTNELDAINKGFCVRYRDIMAFQVDTEKFEWVESRKQGSSRVKYYASR